MDTITYVDSNYGHEFIRQGEMEWCIRCGGTYLLVPDSTDPSRGCYIAADGSEPMECPGPDADIVHGYPGERWCHECDTDDCSHVQHGCNCLQCDS